jgi:hypothetical protein
MEEILKKKLFLIGKLKVTNYNIGWDIFDVVEKNLNAVIKYETHNEFYTFKKFDILKKDEWITYDSCRDMMFEIVDNKLFVDITTFTFNKPLYENQRVAKWSARIELPMDFIVKISSFIEFKFEVFCEKSYETYLESMRISWINKFKNDILA